MHPQLAQFTAATAITRLRDRSGGELFTTARTPPIPATGEPPDFLYPAYPMQREIL
jgi:hypothetical protein